MNLLVDKAAIRDLERIVAWFAKDDPTAARNILLTMLVKLDRLAWFPELGRQGRTPGSHEWLLPVTPYIVVYELRQDRDTLIITAVFLGARNIYRYTTH